VEVPFCSGLLEMVVLDAPLCVVIELFTFHFSVTALVYGLRSLIAAERVIAGHSIEAVSVFQAHAMQSV
jgi:hypothetical protein